VSINHFFFLDTASDSLDLVFGLGPERIKWSTHPADRLKRPVNVVQVRKTSKKTFVQAAETGLADPAAVRIHL
jgi:hypothetical protein